MQPIYINFQLKVRVLKVLQEQPVYLSQRAAPVLLRLSCQDPSPEDRHINECSDVDTTEARKGGMEFGYEKCENCQLAGGVQSQPLHILQKHLSLASFK